MNEQTIVVKIKITNGVLTGLIAEYDILKVETNDVLYALRQAVEYVENELGYAKPPGS